MVSKRKIQSFRFPSCFSWFFNIVTNIFTFCFIRVNSWDSPDEKPLSPEQRRCNDSYVNKSSDLKMSYFNLFIHQRCVQTYFQNALTRVIQFVCTHRRSYETTPFEKNNPLINCAGNHIVPTKIKNASGHFSIKLIFMTDTFAHHYLPHKFFHWLDLQC